VRHLLLHTVFDPGAEAEAETETGSGVDADVGGRTWALDEDAGILILHISLVCIADFYRRFFIAHFH